jgi:hypothetical protein
VLRVGAGGGGAAAGLLAASSCMRFSCASASPSSTSQIATTF